MATAVRRRNIRYSKYDTVPYEAYDGSAARQLEREEVLQPRPVVRPRERAVVRPRVRVREAGAVSPFAVVGFLAVGVFQACGLGKNAFLFAILRKVVLEIPALVLLNALFPLYGLAYAQFAAELVLAIAAVIVLARLFRKLERRYQPKG